jgi:hypothetical protein
MNRLNQTEPATFSILLCWAFFRDSALLYFVIDVICLYQKEFDSKVVSQHMHRKFGLYWGNGYVNLSTKSDLFHELKNRVKMRISCRKSSSLSLNWTIIRSLPYTNTVNQNK